MDFTRTFVGMMTDAEIPSLMAVIEAASVMVKKESLRKWAQSVSLVLLVG